VSVTISVPQFPDVQVVAGIPPIPINPNALALALPILAVTDSLAGVPSLLNQWGIYDGYGNPVIIGDAVISVDFRGETDVPDYPVENGGFASYNKFVRPKDIRVSIATGGSTIPTATLFSIIDAAVSSTDLYSVVTPDATYPSVNLDHYDYRRTAQNGAQMVTIDVWATEIRVTGTGQFSSNTQTPAGASPVSSGTVQPQNPSASQIAAYNAPYESGAVTQQTLPPLS
jgi:hypothetical protein